MLSPEVWSFSAPRVTRSGLLRAEQADVAVAAHAHGYYHTIAVVCPDEFKIPEALLDVFCKDNEFYKVSSCPARELINSQFIEHFIRNGNITSLSVNRHCDIDNCVAITEDGILILHVVDKLYQELGLEGINTSTNFFEIYVDLKSEKLKSNKYYNKVEKGLQILGSFDLIIKWKPHEEQICPSSIAKHFYERNVEVSTSVSRVTRARREVGRVPQLSGAAPDDALVEWVGALATGADLHPQESYVSTYLPPALSEDEAVSAAHAAVVIANGFFTPDDIINLHSEITKYSTSRDEAHWTAMSFHTFTDAPWVSQSSITFKATDATYTIFTQNASNFIHKTVVVK